MLELLAFGLAAVAVIVALQMLADRTRLPAAALLTLAGLIYAVQPGKPSCPDRTCTDAAPRVSSGPDGLAHCHVGAVAFWPARMADRKGRIFIASSSPACSFPCSRRSWLTWYTTGLCPCRRQRR